MLGMDRKSPFVLEPGAKSEVLSDPSEPFCTRCS